MEWQDWLEKTEPTGLTDKKRKLAEEIAAGDHEDQKDLFVKNPKVRKSWEIWLEKHDGDRWDKPKDITLNTAANTHIKEEKGRKLNVEEEDVKSKFDKNRRLTTASPLADDQIIEGTGKHVAMNDLNVGIAHENKSWKSWLEKNDPCWEGYEQYGMKDKDGKKVPNCIKKNNATETSHKEGEKKEEWNGKFDNSTTRDDAENDDDKAIGEEESLEELTDGKLEEVEKLKSWELWLEKDALTNRWIETIPKKPKNNAMEDSQNYSRQSTGARYDYDNRSKRSNKPKYSKLGDVGDVTGDTILTNEGEKTGKFSKNHNVGGSKSNALADSSKKRQQNAVTKKPTIPSTGEAPTGVEKSWELFLEKGITYEDKNPTETDPEKIMLSAKNPRKKITLTPDMKKSTEEDEQFNKDWSMNEEEFKETYEPEGERKIPLPKVRPPFHKTGDTSPYKSGEYSTENAEKWKSWLEKMQGAGDARYGNQHLTGMEQKPVDDDESIDLSAESDKNNEKQEKTEDKEGKDNKPYKALS